MRSRVEQEVAKRLEVELLSIQEKRVILARIVRGEMYIEQNYKGKNCNQCTMYVKPSFNIILRAIQEDSRLARHYPDRRTQIHNKLQQPSAASSTSQLKDNNQRVKSQQPKEETPLLFLGGDIGDVPMAQEPIGVVDSQTTQIHNISQQPSAASSTSPLKNQNERVNIPNAVSSTRQLKDNNQRVISQQSKSENKSPRNKIPTQREGKGDVPPHTITHAGLRKLFSKTQGKSPVLHE